MCNPTPSPTQASTSSQSSGSRSSMPPASPASTHTGMASTNSPNNGGSGPSRPRSIRRGSSAPILKLVASLRNSEDRESPIRRIQRPPSPLSVSRDVAPMRTMAPTRTRTPTPTRRMIFRRPFHGEESRDDSQGRQYPQQNQQQQQQQQPEEEQTGSIPFDEEDEDEIPGLIDEDQEEEDMHRLHLPWDDHQRQRQRRTRSLPREPLERIAPSPFASLPSGNFQASVQAQQQQQQQQQPPKKEEEDAVPFFLLDKMLEDLVPDHQNAQDLARILHEQQQESQFTRHRPFSQMRKTKSCGRFGPRAASPIIQRLLPWTSGEDSKPQATATSTVTAATSTATAKATNVYRPLTPPPTRDQGIPPMPVTPKSSNRKNSKLRQKQRKEALIAPKSRSKDNINGNDNDNAEDLFVPRNLDMSLGDCETAPAAEAVTNESNSDRAPSAPLKLIPRLTSKAPKALATGQVQGNSVVVDTKAQTRTKKSASCPQLYQEEEGTAEEKQEALHSLRQRAKEQHNRRERRNKQTVIQRSLTLAQGWNNKGLSMAGRATQAEQFGNATRMGAAQQQQHPQQHSPDQWWESSLECWDNALEIYRSLLGEYHERVADVQNNRGIALGKLGRFDEALLALGMAVEARKKQEERAKKESMTTSSENPQQQQSPGGSTDTPASAAIVSTLHNIANVFRDAGNPSEALRVLVEAQDTLTASEQDQASSIFHRHHCWHQSARLSTAIGHIYYESESWRDARDAYGQALEVYEKLSRSLSMQSEKLGWGHQASSSSSSASTQEGVLSTSDPHETRRLQLLHHRQLIQREVSVLERDLDELDRCQQAKQGSRARLLQARKQQHQQSRYETTTRRSQQQAQQQKQQQQQQQPPTLLGIVSSLRA